jgi:hypothetical protein
LQPLLIDNERKQGCKNNGFINNSFEHLEGGGGQPKVSKIANDESAFTQSCQQKILFN